MLLVDSCSLTAILVIAQTLLLEIFAHGCHSTSVPVYPYVNTNQFTPMLMQTSLPLCRHKPLCSYVDTNQFTPMSTQTSLPLCRHKPVYSYVDTNQFTPMSTQTSLLLCRRKPAYPYVNTSYSVLYMLFYDV